MRGGAPAGRLLAVVGVGSLLAVGAALVTQYRFGMQPCPWCVLQRLIFVAIAGVCAIGAAWRTPTGRRIGAGLALLLAASGIAAALWQHFRAAPSGSCAMTLADRIVGQWLGLDSLLPEVFSPRASCAEAAVDLFGAPYDFWSLGLFILAALGAARALRATAAANRFVSRRT